MARKLKLITEQNYDMEIVESNENKSLYVMGVFSNAETKNGNNRIYPKEILEREIKKLQDGPIKNRTCIGTIGHPESPETPLEKSAIIVEELSGKGNDVYGKAKVLNTPSGQILKSLINDNITVGISSRGLGEVSESGVVKDSFKLLSYDIVASPSCSTAWVNGVYEGKYFTEYESEDIHRPTEEQIKQVIKEHEKKIGQILKSFRGEK